MAYKIIYIVLLISFLIQFKACFSFPSRYSSEEKKPNKILDPLPLFVMSNLPLEVDEPSNKIEDFLPGKKRGNDNKFPSPYDDNEDDTDEGRKSKKNFNGIFASNADSCCPTVVEVIEPLGGKNRSGDLVELYQGDGVHQRFYEVSCAPLVVDQPCRYLDRRHTSGSKCVQQYSYTYALVRDFGGDYDTVPNGGWRLDYIQVRSGCSCQIAQSTHSRHHGSHGNQ